MKVFEAPQMEVTVLAVVDVITTSEEFIAPDLNGNQTPYG